jgi:hypothetical protein
MVDDTPKIVNSKRLFHKQWNTMATVQMNGVHRVYKNNSRKKSDLILNRKGQEKIVKLLKSFGYQEVTEDDFEAYFKK